MNIDEQSGLRYLSKLDKAEFIEAAASLPALLLPGDPKVNVQLFDSLGGKTAEQAKIWVENLSPLFGDDLPTYIHECVKAERIVQAVKKDFDDIPHAALVWLRISDGGIQSKLLRDVITRDGVVTFLELMGVAYFSAAGLAFQIYDIKQGLRWLHEGSEARRLIDWTRTFDSATNTEAAVKAAFAKAGANALHDKPGGSREKRRAIQELWKSGKYSSRDQCAEQECAALDMSFSAARKALRGIPKD